ncbi:hypothetical protein C8J57DRAFT_1518402 [Mycena rebaudengoi]|nr:hypothetical protein C8J57DRAFT_1518402 [Mycena rebaudengoi]
MLYCDRSIVLKSLPLRFTTAENRPTFLAINLTHPGWGYPRVPTAPSKSFPPKDHCRKTFGAACIKGHVLSLHDRWKLVLADIGVRRRKLEFVRKRTTGVTCSAIYEQSFDELTPACQTLLLDKLPAGAYEAYVLRVIVQAELTPTTDLQDPSQLAKVLKENFQCSAPLDVSLRNLMLDEIDGTGVLNDFDLALMNKEAQQSRIWRLTCSLMLLPTNSIDATSSRFYTFSSSSNLRVLRREMESPHDGAWQDFSIAPSTKQNLRPDPRCSKPQ